MNREQWILIRTMSAAVQACNAVFCDDASPAPAEPQANQQYLAELAAGIAAECSPMMLDDTIGVLSAARTHLCRQHEPCRHAPPASAK